MTNRTVTLRNSRDGLGSRYLGATLATDGSIRIEGQDLGDGVEQIFGCREYEWSWTIPPHAVVTLSAALGAGDDVLAALQKRFSSDDAAELQPFLDANGVAYESWSRIGD